ncbi:MAG: hypothetical protein AAGK93_00540 [Pseudomonadota bacterium]
MSKRNRLIRNLKRETSLLATMAHIRDKAVTDYWAQEARFMRAKRELHDHDARAKT